MVARVRIKPEVIRNVAARRNQSLEQLAGFIGVDNRYFYRLLVGEIAPSPRTRANICRKLGLSFDDLFELADSRSPSLKPTLTITVAEAAKLIGSSEAFVRRGIREAKIPAIRIGRIIRVAKLPLLELLGANHADANDLQTIAPSEAT